uniref:Putative ovule protein n=1 Tax=Solanum chacoense TaxID=4108 RepID=A0A0V0HNV5_SOLCH
MFGIKLPISKKKVCLGLLEVPWILPIPFLNKSRAKGTSCNFPTITMFFSSTGKTHTRSTSSLDTLIFVSAENFVGSNAFF